ncbi:hypothetical protein HYFRA_00006120 [Hymenoscyphus fraxineus]|uniref:Uncharacterized protein n=1 Tax=Hymenoscyphus fraxineus TaxID=746836 RepID=A0A9N9L7D2_9HELO|nr:hypothetical protein HYFRA_00006120 [Hymenoscyphus fraxineus]
MKATVLVAAIFGFLASAAPMNKASSEALNLRAPVADNDDYVVYPDVDGDEDVVYAYHAINDK